MVWLKLRRATPFTDLLRSLETNTMSKRQVMVIASALIMVAGGTMASKPDHEGGYSTDVGGLGMLVGLVLFIAFAVGMSREKS